VDRKKKETWPLSTSDDNRGLTVGIAGCARPGPQVPDAMPTSIARQVNEWQVRESEVRECVLVTYKSEGWASTLLMIGSGTLIIRPYWLVEGDRGWTERGNLAPE
jgi:hypothetical protein